MLDDRFREPEYRPTPPQTHLTFRERMTLHAEVDRRAFMTQHERTPKRLIKASYALLIVAAADAGLAALITVFGGTTPAILADILPFLAFGEIGLGLATVITYGTKEFKFRRSLYKELKRRRNAPLN